LQYRLRNKPKSIKIIAKSSSKNIFRIGFLHIYTLHLTTFFKNENVETIKKVKKRKKRDLNKNVKTFITSMEIHTKTRSSKSVHNF